MRCSISGRRALCMMGLIFRRLKLDGAGGIEIERSRWRQLACLIFCYCFYVFAFLLALAMNMGRTMDGA